LSGLKGQSQKAEQEGFARFFKEIVLKRARQSQKAEQKGFARFFKEIVLKRESIPILIKDEETKINHLVSYFNLLLYFSYIFIRVMFTVDSGLRCDSPHGYLR
jgi:hypothetical protein